MSVYSLVDTGVLWLFIRDLAYCFRCSCCHFPFLLRYSGFHCLLHYYHYWGGVYCGSGFRLPDFHDCVLPRLRLSLLRFSSLGRFPFSDVLSTFIFEKLSQYQGSFLPLLQLLRLADLRLLMGILFLIFPI